MKEPLRKQIEDAAADNEISMNAEMVERLKQSFRDQKELGGRQLYGLLRLLVGAAEFIQERKGKSASDDWTTGLAVGHAWRRLILGWLCAPPDEMIAEVERWSDAPERPVEPSRGGLLVRPATDEEWEAYREDLQNFEKELETFMIAFDEHQAKVRKIQDEVKKAAGIGEEAFRLMIDQEK